MKKNKLQQNLIVLMGLFLISSTVHAQPELADNGKDIAPQEAPYIQEQSTDETSQSDLEFAESDQSNEEIDAEELPKQTKQLKADGPAVMQQQANGRIKYIQHPEAKKGLLKIDKNGVYHYKPKTFAVKQSSANIRLGIIDTPIIVADSGVTDFDDMYGSEPMNFFMYDYEWQPMTKFGKLGINLGAGLFSAVGKGRFLNDGEIAQEKYTIYAIPLNLGLVYRLEFMQRQWVAPYLTGGVNYMVLIETRDDNKVFSGIGTPLFYGGAGAMINLSAIDRDLGFALDAEYGIATMWLTGEVKQIVPSNLEYDFTGSMISLGIAVDY